MKILLIEPPFYQLFKNTYSLSVIPLSLAYLASSIRNNTDCDVIIYNADFSPVSEKFELSYFLNEGFENYKNNTNHFPTKHRRRIEKVIKQTIPDVIGITLKTASVLSAIHIAHIAKELNRNLKIIVGGPHVSCIKDKILDYPEFDIAVVGEGEITIIELLRAIEFKKDFSNIQGIIYRKNEMKMSTTSRDFIQPVDTIAYPLKFDSDVIIDYDLYPKKAFSHIITSRGCPFDCSFCCSSLIWGNQMRIRSVHSILEEMKLLNNRKITDIHFDDDTFGVNVEHAESLCDEITRQIPGISWSCETHVNMINGKLLMKMRNAGCHTIQLGVESGNNDTLKKIGKKFTIEKALSVSKLVKEIGFRLEVFFMVGFPFETESALQDTLRIIKTIDCDKIIYSIFTPYPGTRIFNESIKNKTLDYKHNAFRYFHQSPENHFNANISRTEFRKIMNPVEKFITQKNKVYAMERFDAQ